MSLSTIAAGLVIIGLSALLEIANKQNEEERKMFEENWRKSSPYNKDYSFYIEREINTLLYEKLNERGINHVGSNVTGVCNCSTDLT